MEKSTEHKTLAYTLFYFGHRTDQIPPPPPVIGPKVKIADGPVTQPVRPLPPRPRPRFHIKRNNNNNTSIRAVRRGALRTHFFTRFIFFFSRTTRDRRTAIASNAAPEFQP